MINPRRTNKIRTRSAKTISRLTIFCGCCTRVSATERILRSRIRAAAAKRFEETPSLEIDESIYKSAERELHNNEALASSDEDFDIDELINKYINRSEKPNKSEGTRVDSIVRQLDPRERASAKAETDADDKAAIGSIDN